MSNHKARLARRNMSRNKPLTHLEVIPGLGLVQMVDPVELQKKFIEYDIGNNHPNTIINHKFGKE